MFSSSRIRIGSNFLHLAVTAGVGFGAVVAATDAGALQRSDRRPNIVLILTDDLGYGDVSHLNPDSKIQTARIDRIAREGATFTDAHSPSAVCTPTRYSILTGSYAWRNPRLRELVLFPWAESAIAPEVVTLPDILSAAGYETALIGKWHLGFDWPWKDGISPEDALDGIDSIARAEMFDWSQPIGGGPRGAGFDYYFGDDVPNFPPYSYIENDRLTSDPVDIDNDSLQSIGVRGRIHGPGPGQSGWTFEQVMPEITRRAVRYIEERAASGRPYFLMFATTSPHTPVVPTEEFQGSSEAALYGDFVVQTDDAIGRMVDALKSTGQFENTLVIVTSDNGPSRYQEELIRTHAHRPAANLRGMKADTWEGGHRVPFVASWPAGGIRGGAQIDELVSLGDLYATLPAAAGVVVPENLDSRNVLLSLLGHGPVRQEMVYHGIDGNLALRWNDWVLILGTGGRSEPEWQRELFNIESPNDPIQLFDLSKDPGQKINIAARHPELVALLTARLRAIEEKSISWVEPADREQPNDPNGTPSKGGAL